MKIVLTGGAGFIGSAYLKHLNAKGLTNIIVFDDLTPEKLKNINECKFYDYMDKKELRSYVEEECGPEDILIHLGARSETTARDKQIIEDNADVTGDLIMLCSHKRIPIIYASSASVYGHKRDGSYQPLNLYAFSKMLVDQFVERNLAEDIKEKRERHSPIVGLRFLNVYGPGERHKGSQASVVYNWHLRQKEISFLNIFEGENIRDFVYVDDICSVIDFFVANRTSKLISGIYDVGSGVARDFKDIAEIFKERYSVHFDEISIPDELKDQYQTYTCANLDKLRSVGYDKPMTSLEDGVNKYLDILDGKAS